MGVQFIDKRGSFANLLKHPHWDVSRRAIYQINVSSMTKAGTLKGLHWQTGEFAEYRQVTCLIGKVFDVAVDIRPESPTFLQWQAVELAGLDGQSVLVPPGFAHAVQSLTANCMVHYIHSLTYEPRHEAGLNALDPALSIIWPLEPTNMSDRDLGLPTVHELFGSAGRASSGHL
ncbi:MAG: dTDP-4-dehydrorhamnose 3,5-epimerase family protein [Chloroflexi bacterium]|nr:dTDP-4-dehydrorhamnose 3,5-epimerase family protein [Chloroflexota bacterium]